MMHECADPSRVAELFSSLDGDRGNRQIKVEEPGQAQKMFTLYEVLINLDACHWLNERRSLVEACFEPDIVLRKLLFAIVYHNGINFTS